MIEPTHETVVHMLEEAAKLAPQREALVCNDQRLSYAEYAVSVETFAAELAEHIGRSDRVALVMTNSIDLCIAMFALHRVGAQVVPLNPAYTSRELCELLAEADVSALLVDHSEWARLSDPVNDLGVGYVLRIGEGSRSLITHRECATHLSLPMPRADDIAMLQFTGGTTGTPKAALISHGALTINLDQRAALVPTRRDMERILCVMPLYHCYAIHMCLHNMVYSRGTLVIIYPYIAATVLDTLDSERITLFGGSPTLFSGLMSQPNFASHEFTSLSVSYSGSAPLPANMLRRWESLTSSTVIEGYGQSESGPVISFNPLGGVCKLSSVGLPVPGTDVEIVDPETGAGTTVAGVAGEIRVRGPQIMNGYYGRPEETAEALRDGWLYTGDIGEFDDDGYLYIRGRNKEMLLVSGYNVYPREIEEVLCEHPAVREAAVIGIEDSHRGELPVAMLVARAAIGSDDIARHCNERLAAYKRPVAFHWLAQLPKTSVGKVDKLRLATLAVDLENTIRNERRNQ